MLQNLARFSKKLVGFSPKGIDLFPKRLRAFEIIHYKLVEMILSEVGNGLKPVICGVGHPCSPA
jgi:hypothetical protein